MIAGGTFYNIAKSYDGKLYAWGKFYTLYEKLFPSGNEPQAITLQIKR